MAEPITIQQLIDASMDSDSLEVLVNGDENTVVTTRTGNTYPSAKKAIKTMFENGGFPATPFDTKAKMTTDGASLADGDYAWVTDDTDANNGLYIKRAGAWTLSEFNVLKRVQDYVKRLDAKVMVEDDVHLDVAIDKVGEVYRYTAADGEMHITGLNKSGGVQSNINSLHEQSKNIPTFNQDDRLHNFVDATDAVFAYFDADANLQMTGDIYKGGVLVASASETTAEQIRHQSILGLQPKIKTLTPVATKEEDNLIKRMPFAITTPTGLVYFYHKQIAGFEGDGTGSELWKAIINIDENLNVTVVSRELFLAPDEPRGIVKHPMLGRTSDNRILLMFEKRLERTDQYVRYQCYSSDEGLTFTEPTVVAPKGFNVGADATLGTTGTITTAKNNRLIVPMYTAGGTPFTIYSDDDGFTWTFSGYVKGISYSAEPSISLDINDDLIMSIRTGYVGGVPVDYRAFAKSTDNGETWRLDDTIEKVVAAKNQGVVFRDSKIGALITGHNRVQGTQRNHYTLGISYNNGESFDYLYKPYSDTWYGGYSQILKWREGIYIVAIEYADTFVSINRNENAGLLILSLSEVLSNVSYY